jgi:hypothetical protein
MPSSTVDEHSQLEAAVAEAEAETRASNWPGAIARYCDILRARLGEFESVLSPTPRLTAADAIIVERLADISLLTGHPTQAAKLLKALAATFRQADNRFAADLITLKLLHIAISRGDRTGIQCALKELAETIGEFDQVAFNAAGLADFEHACQWSHVGIADRKLFFAQFFLEAGRLLAWLGQYTDAFAALQRSLNHSADIEGATFSSIWTLTMLELAGAALACGDVSVAREHLAAASDGTRALQIGHEVRHHELTAQAALLVGDFSRAEEALTITRAICFRNQLVAAATVAALNLAHLFVLVNRTVEAEALLSEANVAASALGEKSLRLRIQRLSAFVAARRRSGCTGVPVAPSNAELWGMAESTNSDVNFQDGGPDLGDAGGASLFDRLADYTLGFYNLLERNLLNEAEAWLAQMNEVFESSDSPLIALRLSMLKAMLAYYSHEHRAAVSLLDRLRIEFRERGLRHDWWQANCFRLWCHARLADDRASRVALLAETQDLLNAMSDGLSAENRTLFELNKWSDDEAHLVARIDALVAAREAARRSRWPQRWIAQWRLLGELDALIATIDDRRLELVRPAEPASRHPWWRRVLFHSRHRLTISFVVLPDRVFVAREGSSRFEFMVAPVTRLRVRELVRGWHEAIAAGPARTADALRFADELSSYLGFTTLLGANRKLRELCIVPDDALHGFPFAALRHTGRFIAEDVAVSCDTSHIPQANGVNRSRKCNALVTAMSLASDGLPELPGVLTEADTVARRFLASGFAVTTLLDTMATATAFMKHLPHARVAHVACHGIFVRDDLRRTGLVLAPGSPDGLVSLIDLAGMPLRGTDHVTLTSCWSADNYLLPGRHLLSLPQVLRRAGVGSVLASLWPVADETAAAFHDYFYHQCLRHSKAEALRRTQEAFLHGELRPGEVFADDPFYWAGFVLYAEDSSRRTPLHGELISPG